MTDRRKVARRGKRLSELKFSDVLKRDAADNFEWPDSVKNIAANIELSTLPVQLRMINNWVRNTIPYVPDMTNYGRGDVWETRAQAFANGADCEGDALLILLFMHDFFEIDGSLWLCRDLWKRIDHAVAGFDYPPVDADNGKVTWIADNQSFLIKSKEFWEEKGVYRFNWGLPLADHLPKAKGDNRS